MCSFLKRCECLHTLKGHSDSVTSVTVTPDGRRAVSASWDKTLKVWELESGHEIRIMAGHSGFVSSVAGSSISGYVIPATLEDLDDLRDNDVCTASAEGSLSCQNPHLTE